MHSFRPSPLVSVSVCLCPACSHGVAYFWCLTSCLKLSHSSEAKTAACSDAIHVQYMQLALAEARKCPIKATAFSVGCLIVQPSTSAILSTGYSRQASGTEEEGDYHAEHCALLALPRSAELKGLAMYTTMEPCSVRSTGKTPCVDRILKEGDLIGTIYVGAQEPGDFVVCEGTQKLLDAGYCVVVVDGMQEECLRVARRTE